MRSICLFVVCAVLISGCSPDGRSKPAPKNNGEPSHIKVQHVLIGFEGSVPGKSITRTEAEAAELASEILARAEAGEDFDALVKEYTDDAHPGVYSMANHGEPADPDNFDPSKRTMPRGGMVPAFGDIGFKLEVGEIGMSEFNSQTSPFGWHVIKRLE